MPQPVDCQYMYINLSSVTFISQCFEICLIQKYFFYDNPTWNINYSELVFQVGTQPPIIKQVAARTWNCHLLINLSMSELYDKFYVMEINRKMVVENRYLTNNCNWM